MRFLLSAFSRSAVLRPAHRCGPPLLFLVLFMSASFCGKRQDAGPSGELLAIPWQDERVLAHLKVFTAAEHYMGSARQEELARYLETQGKAIGLEVFLDSFQALVPDPAASEGSSLLQNATLTLTLRNVYARLKVPDSSCVVLLASHYDSKRLDSGPSLGANDSGSSSAALLEIMQALSTRQSELACSIMAIWFDGEEAYLREWQDGEVRHPARIKDHLYGSRHLAAQLQSCAGAQCLPASLGGESIAALYLLDMIGMPEARLTRDMNSNVSLLERAIALDRIAFQGKYYGRSSAKPVEDDHVPFAALGIPVLDLIDFENLSTWHSPLDTLESLSLVSIREISQLATTLAYDSARRK